MSTLEPTPETPKSGPNWTAIIIGIVVVIVAILIIFALMNRSSGTPDSGVEVTPAPAARITIEEPTNGAVLNIGAPFAVRGAGEALPEGNVVVEAMDGAGNVLATQPTTVTASDAGTGGAGPWSTQITVATDPGTPGSIRAYSSSPKDGSILAETSVSVTYGEAPAPAAAAVSIDMPLQGEIISAQEVVVVGQGTALPENNVVVRAVTDSGQVLAEVPTTVNAELGGTGEWRVTLQYSAAPGAIGQIVAESASPADGSLLAADAVDVQFGQAAQPALSIVTPASGASVDPAQFTVSGNGSALPENNVIVRALDAGGNVLAETPTTMNADVGGSGPWSATLSIGTPLNTPGTIVAFSTSPADGSVLAQSEVGVVFNSGQAPAQPAISISSPVAGASVDPAQFTVSGTGTALPENNVVVRALDAGGNVLAETPTTVNADVGGSGPWSATLSTDTLLNTQGTIVAFSTSPADGSVLAQTEVGVVFNSGEAPAQPAISISSPAAGEVVNSAEIIVNGTGTALPENNVVVRALDADGNVLAETPTTVNADVGGSGPWSATLVVEAGDNASGRIEAFSTSPADGSIVAQSGVDIIYSRGRD